MHKISQSGSAEIWRTASLAQSIRHTSETEPKTKKQSNEVWGLLEAEEFN